MDARAMSRMARFVGAAAGAAGLDPADIMAGPGSVGILGTGVDVAWRGDAGGGGGWELHRTEHMVNVLSGEQRTVTETVGSFAPDSLFQAARAAVLLVIQRRIEVALSSLS